MHWCEKKKFEFGLKIRNWNALKKRPIVKIFMILILIVYNKIAH